MSSQPTLWFLLLPRFYINSLVCCLENTDFQCQNTSAPTMSTGGIKSHNAPSNGVQSNGNAPSPLLRLAIARLNSISSSTIPAEVYKKVTLCILDFIAAAHTGLASPLGQRILKYAANNIGKPEATAFGMKESVCGSTAVFINTTLAQMYVSTPTYLVYI